MRSKYTYFRRLRLKPVKRLTKPFGHLPIPKPLNLKKPSKRRAYNWHPRRKFRLRHSYGKAGMNPCRAWSKRPKAR